MVKSLLAVSLWATASLAAVGRPRLPIELETRTDLDSRLANVHITRRQPVGGTVTYTFGSCDSQSHLEAHHTIAKSDDPEDSRLVWVIPEEVADEGCITAWEDSGKLVGRSSPQQLHKVQKRTIMKRHICTCTAKRRITEGVTRTWAALTRLLCSKHTHDQ